MDHKLNINKSLKECLKGSNHFFCISHYDGDLSWVKYIKKNKYIIYNKSSKKLEDNFYSKEINNFGYNLYSYLLYICDNYENLPDTIVFCKDNVFKRHIKEEIFMKLLRNNVFTSLEDINYLGNGSLMNIFVSDHGFIEINNSWYKNYFPRKYFSDFNKFYNFIFKSDSNPQFIRFAPGANYILPKENILLRSKNFYANLIRFLEYSNLSCESHFLERSLISIWNSNVESSEMMNTNLSKSQLSYLANKCNLEIKNESYILIKFRKFLLYLFSKVSFYILKFLIKS